MKYTIIDNDVICLECYDEETFFEDEGRKDNYTLDDCVLVRTTNAFPFNHEAHSPLLDNAYDFGLPFYFEFILSSILKEKYPETWEEEIKKYFTYYENLRKTVHFAINGLVPSTMYGNFDFRSFIIIEPLKFHIETPPISLRPEDTFFRDKIELSEECALLLKFEEYETIKNDPMYKDELKNYKIIVYKGNNEVQALHNALNILGYDAFMISDHSYTITDRNKAAGKMASLLSHIADENDILQSKHRYTREFKEDSERMEERNRELDELFLNYIFINGKVSKETRDRVLDLLPIYSYNANSEIIIRKMIEEIGLEKLAELTRAFNKEMLESNRQKEREKSRKWKADL